MEFADEDSEIKLSIEKKVSDFYMEFMKKFDFKVENGGIIVGTLNPAERQVVITDITTPYEKDRIGVNSFKRAEYGHQQEMDCLWKNSNNTKTYLGEWHTHKQAVPIPSFVDSRDWKRISQIKMNYKYPFFIIVGLERLGVWTIKKGKVVMLKEVK